MIRIIAGKHKNRLIPTLKNAKYRPSTSKFREAVFSILTSGEFAKNKVLLNNKILDLFCGTGSLGFEALSRGSAMVTFVDINYEYLRAAKEFAALIGELENTSFLKLNAVELPKARQPYDIIFMDPPYNQGLVTKTIKSLLDGDWLKDNSIIVIELAANDDFVGFDNLKLIKQRVYGNNKLLILQCNIVEMS